MCYMVVLWRTLSLDRGLFLERYGSVIKTLPKTKITLKQVDAYMKMNMKPERHPTLCQPMIDPSDTLSA